MRALRGIILAGGRSSRLGGRHKPAIRIGGEPMVARAVAAAQAAGAEVCVVGESDGVPAGVPVLREDPAYGGPLAAVAAGMDAFEPRAHGVVLLIGGDMPFLTPTDLASLAAAAPGGVALAVDAEGRAQPLCAAWDEAVLRARLSAIGDPANRPLRILLDGLEGDGITPILTLLPERELLDVDTPEDLRSAQSPGS